MDDKKIVEYANFELSKNAFLESEKEFIKNPIFSNSEIMVNNFAVLKEYQNAFLNNFPKWSVELAIKNQNLNDFGIERYFDDFCHAQKFDEVIKIREKRFSDASELIRKLTKHEKELKKEHNYSSIVIAYCDKLNGIEKNTKINQNFPKETYMPLPNGEKI